MIRNATALIDIDALQHNFQRVKQFAPRSKIMAVIKADAYGHGMLKVAHALSDADAFAVACVAEARVLRAAGISLPIVIFQGFLNSEQLQQMAELDVQPVIHQLWQIDMLEQQALAQPISVWLKVNTGMGRLGVTQQQASDCWQRLQHCQQVADVALMSHFANADQPDHASNQQQIDRFTAVSSSLSRSSQIATSLSNSAGLIAFPQAQGDWVRPGIMLYGASPFGQQSAADLDLCPVMQLRSRLIAINHRKKGDVIGYGSLWQCPEDMPVGVVGIGYGDGYPRHAQQGTPVWLHGRQTQVLGRVSMDMLSIDLRGFKQAECGDDVILWGQELSVDVVARHAQSIAYELLCNVSDCRLDP